MFKDFIFRMDINNSRNPVMGDSLNQLNDDDITKSENGLIFNPYNSTIKRLH